MRSPQAHEPVSLGAATDGLVDSAVAERYREKLRQTPIAEQGTRIIDRTKLWSADLVVLLGCALRKAEVLPLLESLATPQRGTASSFANHLLSLDSASRRARLAREFGERNDGGDRLRALIGESPALEQTYWRRMPAHHQRSYPHLASAAVGNVEAPPLQALLVERLVKEALR